MSETSKTVNESTIVSANTGDVLIWNGTDWVRLPAAASGYVLTSNGPGVVPTYQSGAVTPGSTSAIEFSGYGIIQDGLAEVSQYISNTRFKANFTFSPVSVVLTDDDGSAPKDVSATPNSFSSDGYFQKNNFGDSVIFTLTTDGYTNTFPVIWGQRNYFGVGPAGQSSESFIISLNSIINTSVETVFSVNASINDKIYYAFRTGYGIPSIYVDGFEDGFIEVSTTIAVTNPYGFVENYTLYESDNLGLGIVSIEVFI